MPPTLALPPDTAEVRLIIAVRGPTDEARVEQQADEPPALDVVPTSRADRFRTFTIRRRDVNRADMAIAHLVVTSERSAGSLLTVPVQLAPEGQP